LLFQKCSKFLHLYFILFFSIPSQVDDYDRPSSRAVQPNFTLNPKLISHQPNRQYVEYPRPSTVPSYSWNRPNKDLTNNEPYLRESAGIDYVPQVM
jgi:hypothetical protein